MSKFPKAGDTVVVHGRALIDGMTTAEASVIKCQPDGRLTASIMRNDGRPFPIAGIINPQPNDTGETWWEWPEGHVDAPDDEAETSTEESAGDIAATGIAE